MKKRAFTMIEVLITLAIVGVISALMIPAINKIRPDENKMMYLKAYDSLVEAVHGLANNKSLYSDISTRNVNAIGFVPQVFAVTYNLSDFPFIDDNMPSNPNFRTNDFTGLSKFGSLLREALNGTGNNINISGQPGNLFRSIINFSTSNGMQWSVSQESPAVNLVQNNITLITRVTVDINGNEGPNSLYNAGNANVVPDRFRFFITADAKVFPLDQYGHYYLDHRMSFVKKTDMIDEINAININEADYIESVNLDNLEIRRERIE